MCEVCVDDFSNERGKRLFACDDVSVTGLKLQIYGEQGANVEERRLCLTKQKSRLNGTGGQQWYSGESKDLLFNIERKKEQDTMCEVCVDDFSNESDKTLFACDDVRVTGPTKQKSRLNGTGGQQWRSGESKVVGKETVNGEETRLFSTKQKSRLNGAGGQQWCSGESKVSSSTEMNQQINEDEGRKREKKNLYFANGHRYLTEHDKWKWRSEEREDDHATGLKLPNWEVRITENGLFSMTQTCQLTDKGDLRWHSGEGKRLKLQIREDQIDNTNEKELSSMKMEFQMTDEGRRQWHSGDGKDVSVTGPKLQICEEQRANGEERRLCLTKQKSRLNGTGGQQWCSGESKGMATRLMFDYRETEWEAKKRKQFSGHEIEAPRKRQEITVSMGVKSNTKDTGIVKKESKTQASDFGCDFEENESEREVEEIQKVESVDGRKTSVQIHNAVESKSKSEAQRRSRKGIPSRRPREDDTSWKEQSDDVSESNGLVSRGSSPENEGYDNWLNKRHEHNMSAEPEMGKQKKKREAQTNTHQEKSDSEEISYEQRIENLNISLPSQELSYQNGNYIQFAKGAIRPLDISKAMKLRNIALNSQANVEDTIETKSCSSDDSELVEINSTHEGISRQHHFHGRELSSLDDGKSKGIEQMQSSFGSYLPFSQIAEKEEVNVTDSWQDVDVVSSSALPMSGNPSLAVQSTILKEYNMADRFGEGIPLNLSGRHRGINTDENLLFHRHPSLFANQNEERQFLPIQQGYALATGGGLADPTYPWGYFNNIAPMMYPVMGSDRMRGDYWLSNTMPSEGGLHLKGSLEKSISQALQNKKTGLSDYQVQNGKYDRENMDHEEHMKYYVNKKKHEGFNNTAHAGQSKEGIRSQSLPKKRALPSDSHLQNGEYNHADVDEKEHKQQHANKHQRCDISQEIRSQVAHLKRTWPFDSHSQNGEYDRQTMDRADYAQRKEYAMKRQKIDGFKDTTEGEFGSAEYRALNRAYDRESMDRGEQRKYHTQKYTKVSVRGRDSHESSKEISHLKDKFQKKVINGRGTDQPGNENGKHETESAEEDDPEIEEGQINQPQMNGSAALEDNHRPFTKKRHSRRSKGKRQALSNPWGKGSYSDLITMALVSAPGRKMTLHEIYSWITANVPYFKDKGDELSSTGWKNSIRHTLSVRQRFVRLPRMLNGSVSHKSWWTLSNDFLQKRSPLEPNTLKPSLEPANEKQATQGTQTEDLVCGWCSCTVLSE